MNKENLLRAADYIETVPQHLFNMEFFREEGDRYYRSCGSTGCVVGHCTILDTEENLNRFKTGMGDEIHFYKWPFYFFFGIDIDIDPEEDTKRDWEYLFGWGWATKDNTPSGAAARIRHFVEHGVPDDFAQDEDVPF